MNFFFFWQLVLVYKIILIFEKALNSDFTNGMQVIFKHGGLEEEWKSSSLFSTYLQRTVKSSTNRLSFNYPATSFNQ